MKKHFSELRSAIAATLVLAVVCCGLYPLVVYGLAQVLFRDKANGSLIVDADGTVRGSRLLGQQFTADKYFHPRPSAAGNGYDASNSSGSNLASSSPDLLKTIGVRAAELRKSGNPDPIPVDLVTASGSGLDPDISVASATFQATR